MGFVSGGRQNIKFVIIAKLAAFAVLQDSVYDTFFLWEVCTFKKICKMVNSYDFAKQ